MNESILSGIQPTGEMHLGNYLGALRDFIELQDKYRCFFFIADLHSLTEDYEPKAKPGQIFETLATFLALGLDPDKSTIFIQSHVSAHTELAWIFSTITPIGELERMTQYKDKAKRQKMNINAGLFEYPILQAADILLYHPTHVPVGEDQVQHLELTNTIARKFNHKFGQTFNEIKPYIKKPVRVMSLTDPAKKMSKSEPGSYIGIFDEPAMIRKKLARAVTATDAPKGQMPAGEKNLFGLLAEFGDKEVSGRFQKEYKNGTIKYEELKQALTDSIASFFKPAREKYQAARSDEKKLLQVVAEGADKASKIANQTLAEVKNKVGLI